MEREAPFVEGVGEVDGEWAFWVSRGSWAP